MISVIVAMNPQRIIGFNNKMPWHLPADLSYFRRITMGKPMVMGRKTYESIGKPLPGRQTIILSHQLDLHVEGCQVIHSLAEVLHVLHDYPELMVIGGGSVYATLLPYAQRLYLTIIEGEFVGDTYFPDYKPENWQVTQRETHAADAKNPFNYTFLVLERVN
nr:type 3 dihydrofolate reductase [Beggiatoa leptomitoformis]